MSNPQVHIILGKDLSQADLDAINFHRKKEFDYYEVEPIVPTPEDENWLKPYFLVKDEDQLLAFGRLHTIRTKFQNKEYPILGVATIVAIEKGKGYGKLVMTAMKKYAAEKGMTLIGFCDPSNSPFYEKCGYSILENGADRFIFLDKEEQAIPPEMQDMLYVDGEDRLVEEMLSNPTEKVTAFKEQW